MDIQWKFKFEDKNRYLTLYKINNRKIKIRGLKKNDRKREDLTNSTWIQIIQANNWHY